VRATSTLRDLVAIQARHTYVEHRHVRTNGIDDIERRRAIVRHADLMAIHPQQHGKALGRIAIVIRDNYPQRQH
jgi:hypothetical protein